MISYRARDLAPCLVLLALAACATAPGDQAPMSPVAAPDTASPVIPPPIAPTETHAPETAVPVEATAPVPDVIPVPVVKARPPKPKPVAPAPKPEPGPAPKPAPMPEPVAAAKPVASRIEGRLQLASASGQSVAPGEVADGLVYFLPKAGYPAPRPGTYSIKTRSKGFSPTLLVVPAGSTVRFPNIDTILHNVYSRSPGNSFELGLYGPGQTRETVLRKPGLVIVGCNVHHNMRANIVVLSTPYYTRPDQGGRFELKDLPAGPGTLVFWHPRADAQTRTVTIPLDAPIALKLVANKPRIDAAMPGH